MAFAQEFNYLSSRHLNTPLDTRAGVAVAGIAHGCKLPALEREQKREQERETCGDTRSGPRLNKVRRAHKRARGVAETMSDAESVPVSGEIIKLTLRLKPKRRKPRS